MSQGNRMLCSNCGWSGYRENPRPCPKCKGEMKLWPSSIDLKPLTKKEKVYIRENYNKIPYPEIAKTIGRHVRKIHRYLRTEGIRLSPEIYKERAEIGLSKGRGWKTGLGFLHKLNSGNFAKGFQPHNTKPIGTISHRYHKKSRCTVVYIKVAPKKWEMLHHHNWEKVNGKVPKKHILTFIDGNTENCDISNLKLMSMRDNAMRNRKPQKDLVMESNRYVAARLGIKGKKIQDQFIKEHFNLIELKRQQLLLQRKINETRRQTKKDGK